MKPNYEKILSGGDFRSLGKSQLLLHHIHNQGEFDSLYACVKFADYIVSGRAADVIEKITITHPEYLQKHKEDVLKTLKSATHNQIKWHFTLLVPRLKLTEDEFGEMWDILTTQALNKDESRIVRVNAFQALFEMQQTHTELRADLEQTLQKLDRIPIPSIIVRLKHIRKKLNQNPQLLH